MGKRRRILENTEINFWFAKNWMPTNEGDAVEEEVERREVVPICGDGKKTADGEQVEDEDDQSAYKDATALHWAPIVS